MISNRSGFINKVLDQLDNESQDDEIASKLLRYKEWKFTSSYSGYDVLKYVFTCALQKTKKSYKKIKFFVLGL